MDELVLPTLPKTRSYQEEMLEASLSQNIVIAMDTGSGKTHIAVLRMKMEADREPHKTSWFLAPTVGLCEQQHNVIKTCIPVPVGLISGALQPDQWTNTSIWERALSSHRIMVSTPQVLLDALRHGYVNLGNQIGLVIFDEAHHAADNHPYNMIMREFYDCCRPRSGEFPSPEGEKPLVMGLTASPIFGGNIDSAFKKIESNLDSTIMTPRHNRQELAKHVHLPEYITVTYTPLKEDTRFTLNLEEPWRCSKNTEALERVYEKLDIKEDPSVRSLFNQLQNTDDAKKKARIDQRLSRAIQKKDTFVHKGIRDFLNTAKDLCLDFGPWAADWYVSTVVKRALRSDAEALYHLFAERNREEKTVLAGVLREINYVEVQYDSEALLNGLSNKTEEFIACLLKQQQKWEEKDEFYSGMVFIARRDAALALTEILRNHPDTKQLFSVGALLGSSESNRRNAFLDITRTFNTENQLAVLEGFRSREKNLVVSTAVGEEGIDIQSCCSVIRWDPPPNMVSWTQSRGRARRKDSSFVLMCDKYGDLGLQIQTWQTIESEMVKKYNRERARMIALSQETEEDEEVYEKLEFTVPSTGAKVTLHSAISHVAHFCSTLPGSMRADIEPIYDISPPDYPLGYHASPGLPELLPHTGPFGATLILPRLLPPDRRVYKTEEVFATKKSARQHVAYQAYVSLYHAGLLNDNLLPLGGSISPIEDREVQALLKEVEKREGLANVREQMNPWNQIQQSKLTDQSLWWSNVLEVQGVGTYRMFTKQKLPGIDHSANKLYDLESNACSFGIVPGEQLLLSDVEIREAKAFTRRLLAVYYGKKINWDDTNYAYLFLPAIDATGENDTWIQRREWAESLASSTQTLSTRDLVSSNARDFGEKFSYPSDIFCITSGNRLFRFKQWSFEKLSEEDEDKFSKKYRYLGENEIQYPLLVVQPIHAHTNFLLSKPVTRAKKALVPTILHPMAARVALDSEKNLMLGLFLPSILHRYAMKLIASHLQKEILSDMPHKISLDYIQEALTSPAANHDLNYERLEVLGDTTLKFVTSLHLIAAHPTWPEGFLTRRKDHAVSNAHLARASIKKNLYRFIIRRPFAVKRWTPDYLQPKDGTITSANDLSLQTLSVADTDATPKDSSKTNIVKLSTKTLADAVESLIGASFLTGGYDSGIACADAFSIDIGCKWMTLSENISSVLKNIPPFLLSEVPIQLTYPEAILGYTFNHKMLLVEALMHSTSQAAIQSVSYERMEFLGDALLDSIVVDALFHSPRKFPPREMHLRKSALVNTHILALAALRTFEIPGANVEIPRWDSETKSPVFECTKHSACLATCLIHSSSLILEEQRDTIARYNRVHEEIEDALATHSRYPWAALARLQSPKFLSDIVESIVGAIYLDSNGDISCVKSVLERLGIMKTLRRFTLEDIEVLHPISRVQEWATKHKLQDTVKYTMVKSRGEVTCTLFVDDNEILSISERHKGKASEEDVRLRVAEEALSILHEKYGA